MADSLKSTGRRDINLFYAMGNAVESEFDSNERRTAALLGLTPETLRAIIAANAPKDIVISTLDFQWTRDMDAMARSSVEELVRRSLLQPSKLATDDPRRLLDSRTVALSARSFLSNLDGRATANYNLHARLCDALADDAEARRPFSVAPSRPAAPPAAEGSYNVDALARLAADIVKAEERIALFEEALRVARAEPGRVAFDPAPRGVGDAARAAAAPAESTPARPASSGGYGGGGYTGGGYTGGAYVPAHLRATAAP